jgi:hypothetical protein
MLFGVRLRSLFTSRWMALLWALLVILTAIQIVGPDDDKDARNGQDDNGAAADGLTNEQRQAIEDAL